MALGCLYLKERERERDLEREGVGMRERERRTTIGLRDGEGVTEELFTGERNCGLRIVGREGEDKGDRGEKREGKGLEVACFHLAI